MEGGSFQVTPPPDVLGNNAFEDNDVRAFVEMEYWGGSRFLWVLLPAMVSVGVDLFSAYLEKPATRDDD